jgi:hypothetical protein
MMYDSKSLTHKSSNGFDNGVKDLFCQTTAKNNVNYDSNVYNNNNNICGNPISTIKGEIHNVLSVIQSDDILRGSSSNSSGTATIHTLVNQFRELNDFLNSVVSATTTIGNSSSTNNSSIILESLDVTTYITPFATAITSPECNASVTGAALSSLVKFVLYGFVSTTQHPRAIEGLTLMAKCVRYCSFQETSPEEYKIKIKKQMPPINRTGGRWIATNYYDKNANVISTGTTERGQPLSKAFYFNNSSRTTNTTKRNNDVWSDDATDEQVVLKLISLSTLIVRCPVSIHLHPTDIVGLFDTCFFIAQQPTASALLRGAAGDSMAHIVLVVFGRAAAACDENISCPTSDDIHDPNNNNNGRNVETITTVVPTSSANDGMVELESEEELVQWPSMDSDAEDDPPNGVDAPPLIDTGSSDVHYNEQNEETAGSNHSTTEGKSIMSTADTITCRTEKNTSAGTGDLNNSSCSPAIVTILHSLSLLVDPNASNCVQLALTLINIALETMSTRLNAYQEIIPILQNTLSKHLLQLGTTKNAQIFSLTLRVIFNLFNSLKNHLKVQLEVFLTSVHLRVLSSRSEDERMKELALTSLVEFCNEPALMMDLYYNYDCDVHCSNLFEIVCSTIAAQVTASSDPTIPLSTSNQKVSSSTTTNVAECAHKNNTGTSALHRLAFEGILAVVDGIAKRCSVGNRYCSRQQQLTSPLESNTSNVFFSTDVNKDSELLINDGSYHSLSSNCKISMQSPIDPYVLQRRKQKKRNLALVAAQFNKNPFTDWIQYALSLNIFDDDNSSPVSARSVAKFLYDTPNLDKTQIGLYLSKGPKEKYPFNAEVLREFTSLFDFTQKSHAANDSKKSVPDDTLVEEGLFTSIVTSNSEISLIFSDAIRSFLQKFRLPGEAQCIDRLMEAFATRFYECAAYSWSVFKSSDAIFILSFSTIMLNTDLHNPCMDDAKRMTEDQFIRNNRGINDGENLPEDFLRDLYYRIKSDEIRLQRDLNDVRSVEFNMNNPEGTQQQWEGMLSNASQTPFFTASSFLESAFSQNVPPAGLHEHDMFSCIALSALACIRTIFNSGSIDDAVVVRALQGFLQMASISIYFDMEELFNEIIQCMLNKGEEYIDQVLHGTFDMDFFSINDAEENRNSKEILAIECKPQEYALSSASNQHRLPNSLRLVSIVSPRKMHEFMYRDQSIAGSSSHRGLLGLQSAFGLLRQYSSSVSLVTWRSVISCLCKLRDINAIPPQLGELDDFGDSRGIPFPASLFCKLSRKRSYKIIRSMHLSGNETYQPIEAGGLWGGFLTVIAPLPNSNKSQVSTLIDDDSSLFDDEFEEFITISPSLMEAILSVTQAALFDQFMIRFKDWKSCKNVITALLDFSDPTLRRKETKASDPLFESHAVFALELAARGLVANRNRALELYPLFQEKLDCIFDQANFEQKTSHQYPYLLERSLVTILRACIHLFDIPAVSFVSFISSTHDESFLLSTVYPISFPLSVARPVSRFPETVKPASRFIC